MTDPTRPPEPTGSMEPEPAVEAPPAPRAPAETAAPPAAAAAVAAVVDLDAPSQQILGVGAAVAVLAIVGAGLGAWWVTWSAIVLIAAGGVAGAAAWMTSGGKAGRPMIIAWRDLALAGASIAYILGILFVAQLLFDLDDLDDYGGIVGTIVTVLLAVAGAGLYLLVMRRWFGGGFVGPWTAALGASQAVRLILIGVAVIEIGWLLNVTIGVWYVDPGVGVLTLAILAAVAARASTDAETPLAQRPAAGAAVILLGIAALVALAHTFSFIGEDFGLDDWIPQLVYLAGAAIAAAGAVLWAIAEFGSMLPTGGAVPGLPGAGAAPPPAGTPEPPMPDDDEADRA